MTYIVYITTNLKNGKQYVGDHSTNNINDGYLGSGTALKSALKKYGRKNFKREILEQCITKQLAFDLQEKYIIQYNTMCPDGYNISPTGGIEMSGGKLSNQTKEKMSLSKLGIKFSDKHKENLRKAHIGLKQSLETIEKRCKKTRGKKRSEEFKNLLRKPKTEETKEKIRKSLTGIRHTPERKLNQSLSKIEYWKNKINRTQTILICPHCKKTGGNVMKRHHFENCKLKI